MVQFADGGEHVALTAWAGVEPAAFERAVQMVLRRRYSDLQSMDGSGGDGGKDAYRWSAEGRIVFEIKSFTGRVTQSQRRQIRRSLETAARNHPEIAQWILVVRINPTPAEDTWFHQKLAPDFPTIKLEWWGQDWLDAQVAGDRALQQALEGREAGLLGAAAQYRMEKEILAGGAADLAERAGGLRERVDDISPNWTLGFARTGAGTTMILEAKTEDAPDVDPISFATKVTFGSGDEGRRRRDAFTQAVDFGGSGAVDLAELRVEGSEASRRLLAGIEKAVRLQYESPVETLERPVRCQLQVLRTASGGVIRTLDVLLRSRTSGLRGVTLTGEDSTGAVAVTLRLPTPASAQGGDFTADATLSLELRPLVGVDVDAAIGVLEFRDAARPGRYICARMKGIKFGGALIDDELGEAVDDWLDAARTLDRLGTMLDLPPLALPEEISHDDLVLSRGLVDSLEGRPGITPWTSASANINAGAEQEFVDQMANGPMAFYVRYEDGAVVIGGTRIPVGVIGIHAPSMVLTNAEEVLSAAPGCAVAKLVSTDGPMTLAPHARHQDLAS